MEYNQYGSGYNAQQYAYPPAPGYSAPYAQPQQQQPQQPYQAPSSTPQIRNPFAPPPPTAAYGANGGFDPDHEQQIAMWQAQYAPADQQMKKGGKNDRVENANTAPLGQRGASTATPTAEGAAAQGQSGAVDSKLTVVRKGGGEVWEDRSLLEWDPKQFRIMVGNLAGEVTDESLAKAFSAYGVAKARVIRDKRTTKSKGYGFVSFLEGESGFKAAREMVGKYIGSHPVTIQRSKANVAPVVKKDPRQNKGRYNKNNKNNKDKEKNKEAKKEEGPLRANTGAGIEKKLPAKTASGLKLLG